MAHQLNLWRGYIGLARLETKHSLFGGAGSPLYFKDDWRITCTHFLPHLDAKIIIHLVVDFYKEL